MRNVVWLTLAILVLAGCKKKEPAALLDNAIIGHWNVESVYFKEVIDGELEEEDLQVFPIHLGESTFTFEPNGRYKLISFEKYFDSGREWFASNERIETGEFLTLEKDRLVLKYDPKFAVDYLEDQINLTYFIEGKTLVLQYQYNNNADGENLAYTKQITLEKR